MSPNLTQLIEQSAALSSQERSELATHLKSSQNSPDRWDLSEALISKRNVEMRQVLAEWRDRGDEIGMLKLLADENFDNTILRGLLRRQPNIDIIRVQDTELSGAWHNPIARWDWLIL